MHLSPDLSQPPPVPGSEQRPKKRNAGSTVIAVVLLLACIILYGAAAGLQSLSISSPLWPWLISIVAALPTGWAARRLMSRASGFANSYVNALLAAILACAVYIFAIYGINALTARSAEPRSIDVGVEKVYTKTRYHSKRVRRNRYTRGEPYKVYYMMVELPGGAQKELSLTRSEYSRYRRGDRIRLTARRGIFGITVVDRDSY